MARMEGPLPAQPLQGCACSHGHSPPGGPFLPPPFLSPQKLWAPPSGKVFQHKTCLFQVLRELVLPFGRPGGPQYLAEPLCRSEKGHLSLLIAKEPPEIRFIH